MIVVPDAPEVIGYIEKRLNIKIFRPAHAFGYMTNDKRPLAAIVINDHEIGGNCELTIVAEKGGLTRGVLRHLASHVFNKLQCRRVTVRTRKSNKPILRIAPRFGFTYENVAQHYYPDNDAVVFRMLKSECPWIKI